LNNSSLNSLLSLIGSKDGEDLGAGQRGAPEESSKSAAGGGSKAGSLAGGVALQPEESPLLWFLSGRSKSFGGFERATRVGREDWEDLGAGQGCAPEESSKGATGG